MPHAGGVLLLVLLCSARLAAQDSLRVLFIGNSHTYVNNLPALVQGLAAAGGHPLVVGSSALGGFTLAQHAQHPGTLAALQSAPWDRVVLQEQSQIPAIPWWRDHSMYPAAATLDSMAAAIGAQTLLFMTWGWELGGLHCIEDSCSVEFRDYAHMQDSVSVAYQRLAQQLGCGLAPAGEAWRRAWLADPFVPLWSADGYHPALEGSYLAACVFYATLFGESPLGLAFSGGLEMERAQWLQRQADEQVALPSAPPARPRALALATWPNPFNPSVELGYRLERSARVRLEVFDLRGRHVAVLADEVQAAGQHVARFSAQGLPTGLYLAHLRSEDSQAVARLLLVR
jgi:hypothetical protein